MSNQSQSIIINQSYLVDQFYPLQLYSIRIQYSVSYSISIRNNPQRPIETISSSDRFLYVVVPVVPYSSPTNCCSFLSNFDDEDEVYICDDTYPSVDGSRSCRRLSGVRSYDIRFSLRSQLSLSSHQQHQFESISAPTTSSAFVVCIVTFAFQ